MVFNAFIQLRVGRSQSIKPLILAAFEEPEAHLHPHAHRSMFYMIRDLTGQKLVSTHSPYVVRVADVYDVRLLSRSAQGGVTVKHIEPMTNGKPTLTDEQRTNIDRFVYRNNGEVLFAKLVVIFEGDTEDYALPVFARHHLDKDCSAIGISLARSDGFGGSRHLVPFLEALGIKWMLFADGDPGGQQGLAGLSQVLGRTLGATSPEIVSLPVGEDLEQHLITAGYRAQLETAIGVRFGAGALGSYKKHAHGQKYKGNNGVRDYKSVGGQDRLVCDFCRESKVHLASRWPRRSFNTVQGPDYPPCRL